MEKPKQQQEQKIGVPSLEIRLCSSHSTGQVFDWLRTGVYLVVRFTWNFLNQAKS